MNFRLQVLGNTYLGVGGGEFDAFFNVFRVLGVSRGGGIGLRFGRGGVNPPGDSWK